MSRGAVGRAATWLALGLLVWLGTSALVTYRLTRRPAPPFEEPLPARLADSFEEWRLRAADGVTTGAWWSAPAEGRATALVLHGLGGARSGYAGLAADLAQRGFGVLVPSLRGHGDSEGVRIDFGWSARHDVARLVAQARRRAPASPVALVGTSLGSAAALFAVQDGTDVAGLMLEAPYLDLQRATELRLAEALPLGLDRLAWWGMRPFAEWMLGTELEHLRPIEAARGLPSALPVKLLFGAEDPYAPPADCERFAAACAGDVSVHVLAGVGHDGLWAADRSRYSALVVEWLDSLSADSSAARR